MPTIDDLISKYRGGGQNTAASGQSTAATSIDDLVAKYRPNSPKSSAKPEKGSASAPTSMASATQKTEAEGAASTMHKSAAGAPWESKKANSGASFQQRIAQAEYERKKQSGTASKQAKQTTKQEEADAYYAGLELARQRAAQQEAADAKVRGSIWDIIKNGLSLQNMQYLPTEQQLEMQQSFMQQQADAARAFSEGMRESKEAAKTIEWEGRADLVSQYQAARRRWVSEGHKTADHDEMDRLRNLIVEGDIRAGNGERDIDASDRIGSSLRYVGKNIASSLTETAAEVGQWMAASVYSQQPGAPVGMNAVRALEQNEAANAPFNAMYNVASTIGASAQQDLNRAKNGLNALARAGVDIGTNMLEMTFDAGVAAATGGSALVPMFARVAGESMRSAREQGVEDIDTRLAYGVTKGSIEVFTESIFNGTAGIYGKGIVSSDVAASLARRLASTKFGRAIIRLVVSSTEEGLEEILAGVLGPLADKIIDKDGTWKYEVDKSELMYEAMIGFFCGFLGTAGSSVANSLNGTGSMTSVQDAAIDLYEQQYGRPGFSQELGDRTMLNNLAQNPNYYRDTDNISEALTAARAGRYQDVIEQARAAARATREADSTLTEERDEAGQQTPGAGESGTQAAEETAPPRATPAQQTQPQSSPNQSYDERLAEENERRRQTRTSRLERLRGEARAWANAKIKVDAIPFISELRNGQMTAREAADRIADNPKLIRAFCKAIGASKSETRLLLDSDVAGYDIRYELENILVGKGLAPESIWDHRINEYAEDLTELPVQMLTDEEYEAYQRGEDPRQVRTDAPPEVAPPAPAPATPATQEALTPAAPAAQILADVATGQQAQETQQEAPGAQVDAAQLLADLTTGQEGKLNIDNAAAAEYTENKENDMPEVENDGEGRSAGEVEGVPGSPLEGSGRTRTQSRGDPGLAGVVLLSQENADKIRGRIKADGSSGVVVELHDGSADTAAFCSALDAAKAADQRNGWAVDAKTVEQLAKDGAKVYITDNGSAGFAVNKDGDIVAVFSNKAAGSPKGATESMIPQAIAAGGNKLDCFGPVLANIYAQHGFIPVARVDFDAGFAKESIPGWTPDKGEPPIYFMMHNGDSVETVVENYGRYPPLTVEALDALPVMDYDAAYEYRDSLLEEQNRNRTETRQELADEREGIPAPATISGKFNAGSRTLNTAQNAEAQTQGEAAPPEGTVEPQRAAQNGVQQGQEQGGPETPNGPPTQTESAAPEGMKRSQTESNTLHSMAEERGGEQESLYYVPTTERQTLTAALNRVDADRVGEMQNLMGKEMWNAEDIDTGLSLYGLLKAESLRSGDNSAANAWAKIVQERGTRSGQALQAFSKWTRSAAASAVKAQEQLDTAQQEGRISPEDAERIGNDIYGFAQELDGIEDGDLTSLRELIKRQSDYRGTGTFRESNFMRMLNEVEDFEWLREFATRQLMNMANDVTVTADLGQKLKAWQVNSQLTRLGTFFRNIGGNVVFGVQDTLTQDGLGVALDWMVSKVTGKRTVGVDKSWFSSKARKGAHDAMVRSILEVAGDVDMTGQGNRYGTTANRTFKMSGNGFERFMSRWEQLLRYSLTTSDRFSRGQIETAVQEGLEGFDLTEEERAELGETMADYRLFQNNDTAYKLSKGIHDVLNILGVGGEVNGNGRTGGFGVGDVINPYPGVPANLAVKAAEYSPANIVKGGMELFQLFKNVKQDKSTTADGKTGERVNSWTAAQQQKAVMDIARGMAGTPMIVLLTALFKSGLAKNADNEEDLDAAAQKRAEGRTGVQINLDAALRAFNGESGEWKDGDDLLSIGWLEPMNAFMAIASMIAEEDGDDATLSSYAKDYFAGAVQSVLEMPALQNIANAVDTFRYSAAEDLGSKVGETALSLGGDALTGMIPAPVGQTARTIDKNYRDVSSDDPFGQVWNNLRNVIPGLRETLPVKTDDFGNPKEYGGNGLQRFINSFVLPGAVNEVNQTETSAAVERLYEATGDANVYPDRNAPTSFKIGDERYRMNAEERRTYHNTYGKLVEQYTGELLLGDKYSDLSDAERVELIGSFKQYASYKAKQEYMEAHGEQYAETKWAKVEDLMDSGISLVDALTWKEAANKDGNGGLSQAEVYDYLIGSDFTEKQRTAIWGTMGYSGENANWASYRAAAASEQAKQDKLSRTLSTVGVSLDDYNAGKTAADVNGNKKVTQDELYTWLIGSNYSDRQKAVIWGTMGWKTDWADYLAGLAKKK